MAGIFGRGDGIFYPLRNFRPWADVDSARIQDRDGAAWLFVRHGETAATYIHIAIIKIKSRRLTRNYYS